MSDRPRIRVLTWHVHGAYLASLAHADVELVVPVKPGRPEAYGGRGGPFAWPDTVVEVPAEAIAETPIDCVLTQSVRTWTVDRPEICSPAQLAGPRIHLEHDPPRASPFDEPHPVDDPGALLVHVTPFNALMWDSGRTPVRVIEHGVAVPADVRWTGELDRGLVIVNDLDRRGRRLGADLVARVGAQIPLDVAGMGSDSLGNLAPEELWRVAARYRFLFNPIRWTSLGLAVCEAMAVGLPVVGLATTEMATAVQDGVSGYVDTDVDRLVERMRALLDDRTLAARLSEGARERARTRFGLARFAADWTDTFAAVCR